jgi:hypothetical protein
MHYQNFFVDYIVQERERKGLIVYLKVGSAIDDVEPSDITAMFLLLLSKDIFQSRE